MNYRTNFRSLVSMPVIAMLCISAAPALGKGKPPKPEPDPPTRPNVNYDITWLNLGGEYEGLDVRDVNPQGTTIVGLTTTADVQAAVRIDAKTGVIVDLNTIVPGIRDGWRLISARGITRSGRIAGELIDNLGQRGLYVYDDDAALPEDRFQTFALGYDGGVGFRDMNENGDVLYIGGATRSSYVYTYDKGEEVPLPASLTPPKEPMWDNGRTWGPMAINNDRLIAGNFHAASDTTACTYDYRTETTTTIESLFQSLEINDAGDVVGRGELVSTGNVYVKATMYRSEDRTKTLLTDTIVSTARDINEVGQVAGTMYHPKRKGSIGSDVFLYDPDSDVGFWALADLIEDPEDAPYWDISGDSGANSSWIAMSEPLWSGGYPVTVGNKHTSGLTTAWLDARYYSPYILTPSIPSSAATAAIPEPTTLTLTLLGLLGLLAWRRKRAN